MPAPEGSPFVQGTFSFHLGLDWNYEKPFTLNWTGLDWSVLEWTGLDCSGLEWTAHNWLGMKFLDVLNFTYFAVSAQFELRQDNSSMQEGLRDLSVSPRTE